MSFFVFRPSSLPALTAARSMSPVEICGMPYFWVMKPACVPLPAPGGPKNMSRIVSSLSSLKTVESSYLCRMALGAEVPAHALQVFRGIHACLRGVRAHRDRRAVTVPERAQLFQCLESL